MRCSLSMEGVKREMLATDLAAVLAGRPAQPCPAVPGAFPNLQRYDELWQALLLEEFRASMQQVG